MLRAPLLHRGRDDDLADAPLEVGGQRLGRAELARALQHDVDAELIPGHVAGRRRLAEARAAGPSMQICLPSSPDVGGQRPCTESNLSRWAAASTPPLVSLTWTNSGPPSPARTQDQPAHPAEAVDADPHRHRLPPIGLVSARPPSTGRDVSIGFLAVSRVIRARAHSQRAIPPRTQAKPAWTVALNHDNPVTRR